MTFLALVILILAVYRVTRFFLFDTLIESERTKLHEFLTKGERVNSWFFQKLYDFTSCSWCFGVWVALVLTSFYFWECPLDWTRELWIFFAAVAGGAGLLHAFEPNEE
jgi:hypothetical protein